MGPEPSLFGIGKTQWELINSFANWLAAAGSFAAALVALYLASRASKPSARVTIGHRLVIGPGIAEPYPEFIVFNIVNTGDRPIRVSQIGWKAGLLRKRFAIQRYDAKISSPLPVELSHGQEASWMVPFDAEGNPWPERFARDILTPHNRIALWTLRGRFFTSVGHIFQARPEGNLLSRLKEVCERVQKT